jgi:Protein of unknown function (DUF3467)
LLNVGPEKREDRLDPFIENEAMAAPHAADLQRAPAPTPAAADPNRIRLNSSDLKSNYCNFFNGNSTREEIVLNFGINQNWDRNTPDREVNLLHRIILSPYAAKRVSDVLKSLINDYETRYGELK